MTVHTIAVASLEQHERVIARGLGTFVEVGQSLAAIRDERLYKETHETFEAYCEQRWGLARTRAYELISAAEITEAVSEISDAAPANEGQAKQLRGLEPTVAADVMREAHEATEGKPTASSIRDARAKVTETTKTEYDVDTETGEVVGQVQAAIDEHVSDTDYVLASWRKVFGKAVRQATSVLSFTVEDVAAKADASSLAELERAHRDLGNYLSRVKKATGLRPVGGRR